MMHNGELITDVIMSVDNDEWYYGLAKNRENPDKRILVKGTVNKDIVVSSTYSEAINNIFFWTEKHEKTTVKKKKRPFYTDRSLFVNPNFSFN